MQVGDLVKYKDHCDATGWIWLVLEQSFDHVRVHWIQTGIAKWIYDFDEVLEVANASR